MPKFSEVRDKAVSDRDAKVAAEKLAVDAEFAAKQSESTFVLAIKAKGGEVIDAVSRVAYVVASSGETFETRPIATMDDDVPEITIPAEAIPPSP